MDDGPVQVLPRYMESPQVSGATIVPAPAPAPAAPVPGVLDTLYEYRIAIIVVVVVIMIIGFVAYWFKEPSEPHPPKYTPTPQGGYAGSPPPVQGSPAPPPPTQGPPPPEAVKSLQDMDTKDLDKLSETIDTLKSIPMKEEIEELLEEEADKQCSRTTSMGARCKNKEYMDGLCKRHYTAT